MLQESVGKLKGIGPKRASVLAQEVGIETIEDLFYFRPRRYLDRSSIKSISDCFVNEAVTVIGTVRNTRVAGRSRRFMEVTVDDGTDTITGIFFGGVQYFQRLFNEGDQVCFSGKISFYKTKQMVHPDFDFFDAASNTSSISAINTGRIVPLYRSSESLGAAGFDSRGFRRIIRQAIDLCADSIIEPLEPSLLIRHNLMGLRDALVSIHFPESIDMVESARRRIAFNELFFLQFYLTLSRRAASEEAGIRTITTETGIFESVVRRLPFSLTEDQRKAIEEVRGDMCSPVPMNRMLQGDVGSGKTVVALLAVCIAMGRGHQAALMAPTEILASQHYATAREILGGDVPIAILTGSTDADERNRVYRGLAEGSIGLVVGTHALIQGGVEFRNLGLIIIDEQHRFGVVQRAALRDKGSFSDLLVMTATPIPRSLSLTIYGDLDLSVIRQKPANRIPVKTMSFPESRLPGVYRSIDRYIDQGRQIYYVLPLIEESERVDLKSAKEVYGRMTSEIFPKRRIALLHGRMKQEEKDRIMEGFTGGTTDILVTTTVIEVGIDVANAAVIVIEHAERFGLSQLHQLRGRVGRGSHQSFCVLIYPDDIQEDARRRIDILVANDDGFIIAEEDLKIRGAGEFLGVRQHGRESGFEFADLGRDYDLIVSAREEAAAAAFNGDAEEMLRGMESGSSALKGMRMKRILSLLT
ncbi:MAG: ATP-dependent DNA helicase RecG [Spirochaetes bacterium]|nr:ATP-dependent DNA helicase RecG [Spirochaetota bacterium]